MPVKQYKTDQYKNYIALNAEEKRIKPLSNKAD